MKRILWVEDDYERLKGLMRPLEKRGFEVNFATDYPSFLKKLEAGNYDLYVVDMLLPQKELGEIVDEEEYIEHTGLKVVEEIDKFDKPIIVVTVVVDPKVHENLMKKKNVKKVLVKGSIFPSDFTEDVLEILGVETG